MSVQAMGAIGRTCFTAFLMAVLGMGGLVSVPAVAATEEVFVGSTPCGPGVRSFHGIAPDSECDLIKWRLTFYRGVPEREIPASYTLQAVQGFIDEQSNLIVHKATNVLHGTWQMKSRGSSDSGATVYEMVSRRPGISLRLLKVDENILQILTTNGNMMIGDEFQSYTLNREKPLPLRSGNSAREVEAGVEPVSGIFRGRTPCQELAAEIGLPVREECLKRKLALTLQQDAVTKQPTTFQMRGMGDTFKEGNWKVVQNPKGKGNAQVSQLTATGVDKPIFLQQGDDNVMFFVKSDGTLLVGNDKYSYTLNRREHPAKWPGYVAP